MAVQSTSFIFHPSYVLLLALESPLVVVSVHVSASVRLIAEHGLGHLSLYFAASERTEDTHF